MIQVVSIITFYDECNTYVYFIFYFSFLHSLEKWRISPISVKRINTFDPYGLCYMIFQAANFLHIKDLLDLTCQSVADMIKGKTPEEIRKTFNIKNDFTPDEEEAIRRENQWAFE